MTRRRFAALATLSAACPQSNGAVSAPEPASRFERLHPTMGTRFLLVIYAADAHEAGTALDAASARLDALNASLSDYLPDSEISRLSRAAGDGSWRLVLDDVWEVLSWGQKLAAQTQGAFDMTLGSLTRLWRISRRNGKMPTASRLQAALRSSGFQSLALDPSRRRARLSIPGTRLDLGGIAKGFAVDEALETLRRAGIQAALVDGGGDLRAHGKPPGAAGWRLSIGDLRTPEGSPQPTLLTDRAVATSGDVFQSVQIGDREFSHLIDPQTGLGLEYRRTVTVLASETITADALASALSVLPIERSWELLARHYQDCAARILTRERGEIRETLLGEEALLAPFRSR